MLAIRQLTPADVAFGLTLSRQAGWNQLEQDWRRCLTLAPDGCFVAEWQGRPVGTATTCIFGEAAWIGMVLVDEAYRGRGIGKALMVYALDFLESKAISSIWLDATPLGRPLYEKLGFAPEATFLRHAPAGPAEVHGRRHGLPQAEAPVAKEHLPGILALDRSVYGYDRSALLLLAADPSREAAYGHVIEDAGQLVGFCLARPGVNAWQIGPCLAKSADAGRRLLESALCHFAGQPVFVDVPETNAAALDVVGAAALTVQRPLYRMRWGEAIPWNAAQLFSSFGPEKG